MSVAGSSETLWRVDDDENKALVQVWVFIVLVKETFDVEVEM